MSYKLLFTLYSLLFTLYLPVWAGESGTIEVVYRWQEPLSGVDEVVYSRLKKTLDKTQADYYYAMYARCKDDILISQVAYKINQAWIPDQIFLDGQKIKYEDYIKLIELSPPGKYHLIYYQKTPDGLLKLGEQPPLGKPYVSDIRFVPKVASAVGEATEFSLWHFAGAAVLGYGIITALQKESKVPEVPPIASFTPIPITGTLTTDFYFDANSSYDPHEVSSKLKIRWDWENNGEWDTTYSYIKTASHTYTATGTYTIKLEVIDSFGLTSTALANVTVIPDGPGLMISSPSPMFHRTITHSGLSPYTGALTNTVKWTSTTGANVYSSPAIETTNNYIYVGSYDGNLYKLNPADGSSVWGSPYAVGGLVHSSPAIASDGTVYVGSGTGELHAITPTGATGITKWQYNVGSWLKSSPVIGADGTIYIGSINGSLYAFNYNGSLKWSRQLGNWIESSPAIAPDGTIYVGSADSKLYAVNPNSTIKWSYPTGGAIVSSPAVASDGTIYVGSYDNYLYAINPDGTLKWRYQTGGPINSSPAIGADGKVYIGSDDNKLHCVNPNDGNSAGGSWPSTTGGDIYSSPVIGSDGAIYIGSDDGKFYCITTTGTVDWERNIGSPVRATPVIANSVVITPVVYIGANNGNLYAIGQDPLDPADVWITKKANKHEVSIGDVITYRITVTNLGSPPVPGATTETYIYDRIPPGFKYVKGSSLLGNNPLNDPDGYNTRNLTFNIGIVALNETKTLSYQLVVGSGVTFGKYENKAYCQYRDPSNPAPAPWKISNTAKETVLVIPDPLFDLGTIIGKAFLDTNGNGIQDEGEKGIAQAQIIMEDGTIVTTDQDGKYHIPGVTPQTHLLRLQAQGVNGSKVARVTEGLLCKVNFPVPSSPREPKNSSARELTLVLLGDGELGRSTVSDDINADLSQHKKNDARYDDGWYGKGRIAGYLKAKTGDYQITSSLDTDRDRNRELYRYIDPDKYYPVYGDDSNLSWDATNTQGPLYLLVEHLPSKSNFLLGNYQTNLSDTELAAYNRMLYGAKLGIKSNESKGSKKSVKSPDLLDSKDSSDSLDLTIFGAQAYQVAAHNEFRATGGSIYYLKHQNIVEGSEQVRIEVRDKITNLPLTTNNQQPTTDYEIDYSNGRIIFNNPIASVESTNSLISTNLLNGHPVYIVVDYEYKPDRLHFSQGTYGGRLRLKPNIQNIVSWVPDFSLGTTYVKEENADRNYELRGVDSHCTIAKDTELNLEYAQSVSYGIPNYLSTDGGLGFSSISPEIKPEGQARGIKLDSSFLAPIKASIYYKKLDPDFISSGTITQQGTEKYGLKTSAEFSPYFSAQASYDEQELIDEGNLATQNQVGGERTKTASLQGKYTRDPWSISGEYRHQDVHKRIPSIDSETNLDTDVAAARVERKFYAGALKTYLGQQFTLKAKRSGVPTNVGSQTNHQTTLGASAEVFKPVSLHMETTSGTQGNAHLAGLQANLSTVFSLISNYSSENSTRDGRTSTVSLGTIIQPKHNLQFQTRQEYKTSETSSSTGSFLGINTQPGPGWNLTGSFEKNFIQNLDQTETRRHSVASGLSYANDYLNFSSRLEARFDQNDTDNKNQYLTYNSFNYNLNRAFALSGRLNWSETLNDTQDRIEALFREYGIGLAYRPIHLDRLNLIGKCTYLVDIGPTNNEQRTTNQRANVYALEAVYDISKYFQVVEKVATKIGKERVPPRDWTRSQTDLWINRLNYHLTEKLDIGSEYRILKQHLADDRKDGFLFETTYKVSDYVRLGIGYNFTDFSDDLIAQGDYSVKGPFIRILATVTK